MSKRAAAAQDRCPEAARPRAPGRSRPPGAIGERVFAADVEEALLRARGEAADGHGFDDRERIVREQHAILERAGLGLVGVAHQVVRQRRLPAHGLPLAAGRERRAATAHELRRGHLADHAPRDRDPIALASAAYPSAAR